MTDIQPTITIIGGGYVGLTTAAILAQCNATVYILEINPERLEAAKNGRSFFFEAGINPLIQAGLQSGRLKPTDRYQEAVPDSDFVFSCVGTPDNADGSSNLSFVFDSAKQAAELMKPSSLFIQKSTVPVGTGRELQTTFQGRGISYVSNPEFLREGTAIADSLWFDRVVAGSDDLAAGQQILDLYKRVEVCRDNIAELAGLTPPANPPLAQYVTTGLASAELIKVSANAFLALKISFANSMAKLADQADADINEVMGAIGADRRIGPDFLNAGRGYGGGCFPKDVSGLIRSAADHGVPMEIMTAVADVNQSMPHYIIERIEAVFEDGKEDNLVDKHVAVLGLAFKSGTSDARRSPAVVIANTLTEKGAHVRVYDPEALEEAAPELHEGIQICADMRQALQSANVIIVATDWPEFVEAGAAGLVGMSGASLIVDAMNCLDSQALPEGVTYIGVGRR